MAEITAKSSNEEEIKLVQEGEGVTEATTTATEAPKGTPAQDSSRAGGGWGGWGFSAFSYLSDLQKVATVAAEEISRNAVEAAKTAAKSISDVQNAVEESESANENETEASAVEIEGEDENDKRRKEALDKLEKASEDSFLGQGLKVIDNSVESIASGAWQALGNALKGGSSFVHKLEESIQQGGLPGETGSGAPSILETGKAFTAKGMQVLEQLGKETMDLLISETGIEVEKQTKETEGIVDEDQLFEEVTFDRCFYIYGGPEQLEELEALSNHYAMLFNRKKVKLPYEQRSTFDGKLKQVQLYFDLSSEIDGSVELEKGKQIETGNMDNADEMKVLRDSSVSKAAELAAGFTNALAGLAPNDMIQRTVGRLESLHSEGVHRLSEVCCSAVTQILLLGKSITSDANKTQSPDEDVNEVDMVKINWPEDSIEKAKIIRARAELMTASVEAVCSSFITGISDVTEAYLDAIKAASADSHETPQKTIQDKVNAFSKDLSADQSTAIGKIQDGLQYLSYLVISTSMPAA
ncbi:PREDICTED: uncharacterized protein LOC109161907 [Ipomoea nil]|uniref:uncharacterized protein LOC109161907 n=1 Tax=Ipomoea nil TaxID=35883 RepID=UPI000901D1A7|nr:PREDICTED: uncharacterized protein LOC109161907 [Ipomoea nil]